MSENNKTQPAADTPHNADLLKEYSDMVRHATKINPDLYNHYNVKRGLRNADGSGVLVGLSAVGAVIGYTFEEQDMKPVPGKLMYRGIEIRDLVNGFVSEKRFGFEETVFLLLFGKLPTKTQLDNFNALLDEVRTLPSRFKENAILPMPSPNVMNKLARCVLACYSFDPNPDDVSVENVTRQCIELIARMPTFAVYGYQAKAHYYMGRSLHMRIPEPGKSTAEHILTLLRPHSEYTRLEAELLDLCLVLHADHGGGNNSTFTTHVVSSTFTDTYSAIAAAILSLKGPRHGGANIRVCDMMEDLKAHVSDWSNKDQIAAYLRDILDKKAFDQSGLIYGLGHAVYKISDPRAEILEEKARELAEASGNMAEFTLYKTVADLGLELFRKKTRKQFGLCVNVDFYSGLVYKMLGIPEDMFTPLFAVGRMPGWAAHRLEELNNSRIIRPAYKCVHAGAKYVPMKKRRAGSIHNA